MLRPSGWRDKLLSIPLRVPGALPVLARLPGPAPSPEHTGAVLNVVAHPDDDLLFLNPDLLHDIRTARRTRTVFLSGGDAGLTGTHAGQRELGIQAAYAVMAGQPDRWRHSLSEVCGHPIATRTLTAAPQVSVMFMRLPDGNDMDGRGYPSQDYQSLSGLLDGSSPTIRATDGSASYTLASLEETIAELLADFRPAVLRMQDPAPEAFDHADHIAAARLTRAAHRARPGARTLAFHSCYPTARMPVNVCHRDAAATLQAINAYARFDEGIKDFGFTALRSHVRRPEAALPDDPLAPADQ